MLGLGLGLQYFIKFAGETGFNISPFKQRVQNDGGTFEAEACLKAEIERIEAI